MNKLLFSLTLILTSMIQVKAQQTDLQLIEKTVQYYLDGLAANDFKTISKAFHKNATMKFISEDGLKEVNAIEFFKEMTQKPSTAERKTRVSAINFSGNAANAQVEIELATYSYFDYLNLLKIDGRWQIVGKIFFKKNH